MLNKKSFSTFLFFRFNLSLESSDLQIGFTILLENIGQMLSVLVGLFYLPYFLNYTNLLPFELKFSILKRIFAALPLFACDSSYSGVLLLISRFSLGFWHHCVFYKFTPFRLTLIAIIPGFLHVVITLFTSRFLYTVVIS